MFNRRSFLRTGLAALPLTSISDLSILQDKAAGSQDATCIESALAGKLFGSDLDEALAVQTVRRVGQLNMTEHDPVTSQRGTVGKLLEQFEGRRGVH